MTTKNTEIKQTAKDKGVFLYEIADRLKMVDTAFSRMLRRELPAEQQEEMLALIDEIAAEKKNAGQRVAAR